MRLHGVMIAEALLRLILEKMLLEQISSVPLERVRAPVMRQSWRDLTFLHWRYRAVEDVRRIVPAGLEIDVCDGFAWVGLVPFKVVGLTLPNAPAVPWLSNFAETNVRTYVVDRTGRRGVWFFSLDTARLAAVIGARTGYGLPYYWSKMRVHCEGKSAEVSQQAAARSLWRPVMLRSRLGTA